METGTVITIEFEDHGQDFWEWDICNNVVIDCRPFQSFLWVKHKLLEPMEALQVGHCPLIVSDQDDLPPARIKYPISAVRKNSALAEEIPCFFCCATIPGSLALEAHSVPENEWGLLPLSVLACLICGEGIPISEDD